MDPTKENDLRGKTAIVTGSAQGIGKSIAERLAGRGATVVVSDLRDDQGRKTAEALGGGSFYFPCDVTDAGRVQALVDETVKRLGRLDVMVNNAGINSNRPEDRVTFEKYPLETWRRRPPSSG